MKATKTETTSTNKATRKPTPAELSLLKVLWQHGPGTAKQVFELAQLERPEISQATVLRQLQMMHADGLLTRDESAFACVCGGTSAAEVAEKLVEGFYSKGLRWFR